LHIPLKLDDDGLDRNKMKRLSWLCFVDEVFWIAPHTPLWEKSFFGASSHIHEHHKNGKLQAYHLVELAHLKLAPHSFLLQL
jgi:hypothetical protein